MNTKITTIPRIYKPKDVCEVELNDVLMGIKSGCLYGQDLKDITKQINAVDDHKRQGELKYWNLPVALFNGTFSYKNNDSLITYSSFTALDFDQFESEEKLNETGWQLTQMPCVYAVFRTPSGKGLKAIVYHDNESPDDHAELFSQLLKIFNIPATDESVKDLSRGNYICYDPNLWINDKVAPYHFQHDPSYVKPGKPQVSYKAGTVQDIETLRLMLSFKRPQGNKSDESIIRILNANWMKRPELKKEGNRANSVFSLASQLCNCGVNIDKAVNYLVDFYRPTGLSDEEIVYQAHRGYQNNAETYGSARSRFDSYGSKGMRYPKT